MEREARAGRWRGGTSYGVYSLKGNRLSFAFGNNSGLLVFAIRRDASGTLHLKQVNQTNPGDTFVWTTEPWRRLGPPPAKIR